jgi:hypothetical protein
MLNNIVHVLMQILSAEFRVYAPRFRPLQLRKKGRHHILTADHIGFGGAPKALSASSSEFLPLHGLGKIAHAPLA